MEWQKQLDKMLGIGYDTVGVVDAFNSIGARLQQHEAQIKKLEEENKELKDLLSTNPPDAEEGAVAPESRDLNGNHQLVNDQEQKIPVLSWTNNGKFDPVAFFKHIKSKYFPDPLDIMQKRILNDVRNYNDRDKIAFGVYSKTFVEIFNPGTVNSYYLKLKGNQFCYIFMMKPDNFVGDLQKPLKEPHEVIDKFQFLIGIDDELYIVLKFLPMSSAKTQLYKISPSDYEANAEFILSELDKWKKEKEPSK